MPKPRRNYLPDITKGGSLTFRIMAASSTALSGYIPA